MATHPLVQQALQLTRQIQDLALADDWEGLAGLVEQRQPLLEQIFQANLPADELHRLAATIRSVDHEVTAAVCAARDATLAELQEHQHKSQAASAYAAQQPHAN